MDFYTGKELLQKCHSESLPISEIKKAILLFDGVIICDIDKNIEKESGNVKKKNYITVKSRCPADRCGFIYDIVL